MTKIYPDKAESAAIESACAEAGMIVSAIATDAIDAFSRGEFTVETLPTWIAEQKTRRPHLFPQPGQLDNEAKAFEGKGNITARGQLVAAIGEVAANARAREWGLTGINDYKTPGVRPADSKASDKKPPTPEKPGSKNPFTRAFWNLTDQSRDSTISAGGNAGIRLKTFFKASRLRIERTAKFAGADSNSHELSSVTAGDPT